MTVGAANGDPVLGGSSAVAAEAVFGLYPASDFRLTDGTCTDCPTIPQALWYFRQETIAVPRAGLPVASFATGVSVVDDLRGWLDGRAPDSPPEYPPLVWVAAPDVVAGARLSADATALEHAAGTLPAALTPKIALNRSYFDGTSSAFFRGRTVKVRGRITDGHDRDAHALAGGLPARPRAAAATARPGTAATARAARAHALRAGRRGEERLRRIDAVAARCGRATRCRRDARCWASW